MEALQSKASERRKRWRSFGHRLACRRPPYGVGCASSFFRSILPDSYEPWSSTGPKLSVFNKRVSASTPYIRNLREKRAREFENIFVRIRQSGAVRATVPVAGTIPALLALPNPHSHPSLSDFTKTMPSLLPVVFDYQDFCTRREESRNHKYLRKLVIF